MNPNPTKQLMIHADDLALCHAKNAATIRAIEYGSVNSGSIMTTCPWIGEIAAFARANLNIDLGVHLTLTNEWDHYRWPSVAPPQTVPTLVDSYGLLHDLKAIFEQKLDPAEAGLSRNLEQAGSGVLDPRAHAPPARTGSTPISPPT